MTPAGEGLGLHETLRDRLVAVADDLIPQAAGMPAPSSLDIGGRRLDVVVSSRPDLVDGLRRALEAAFGVRDSIGWLEALSAGDPSAYEALVTVVVAGYYLHPEVKRLLGYPGQKPQPVSVDGFPDYMNEGLLERVYERGPIYRPTPSDERLGDPDRAG
jgi:hypothetical protein